MKKTTSAFVATALTLLLLTTGAFAQTRPSPAPAPAPTPVIRGAPGPLVGAGPVGLVIGVGYGVYWLVKRRRRKTTEV
jgi:hypothetical protein